MAIGLPKLEQEFYAAAQAASARDKKGVVALILLDAKATSPPTWGRPTGATWSGA